MLLLPFTH